MADPLAVHAITRDDIAIACALFPDGTEWVQGRGTVRRFRVVIESDWGRIPLKRMEVVGWPDDVMFLLSCPSLSEADAELLFGGIGWLEKLGGKP